MKTIGLLGGITCESSLVYYRLVNEMTRTRLGGNHSARSVMVSVDFQQVQPLTERGDWDGEGTVGCILRTCVCKSRPRVQSGRTSARR